MQYRTLTGTGTRVSRFCLGTWMFGGQITETDAIRIVERALEAGVNFFDSADIYHQGRSEIILGKALQGRREGVVVASKVRGRMGDAPKDQGLSRWHILRGVEASLRRLGTDCLDICYFHRPDYDTPLEESIAAADQLIREGKIMYWGMSNYAAWQVCRAQWLADRHRLHAPAVTQVVYNLLTRGIEHEFLPFCRALQVGVTVFNPLAGGLLTGKHDPSKPPAAGTRFDWNKEYYDRYWRESNFSAVAALADIAREAGLSPVAMALRWLAAQPAVDAICIGFSSMQQLEDNLLAWQGGLDAPTLEACDQVWARIRGDSFQYNR